MRQRTCAVLVMLVVGSGVLFFAGCASQEGGNLPDDPEVMQRQIRDLDTDIANTQEMLKGALAERQVEDSMELREYIQGLEMELYQFESQRAALVERYRDLMAKQESP